MTDSAGNGNQKYTCAVTMADRGEACATAAWLAIRPLARTHIDSDLAHWNLPMSDLYDRLISERENPELLSRASAYGTAYLRDVDSRAVYPTHDAVDALSTFSEPLPPAGTDAAELLATLHTHGSPATVAQMGGRYFGMVNGGVIPAALAARVLGDHWDQNPALYALSPVAATLEQVCEDWLTDLLGLPADTALGVVSGSSIAIFSALAAARWRLLNNLGWDVNARGLLGAPALRVITSTHTHGTVKKAIALLGFGLDNIEWVEVDEQGRLDADRMPDLDASCLVILQAGNVNSGAFDPFARLCRRARDVGAWVHVDGAFGLWAAANPAMAELTAGLADADSWSADGHKTLNTPYDNGLVLTRDRDALINALQLSGDYVVWGAARDNMLYTPEMSRRARGVELWAALKSLGCEGVAELVQTLHDRACQFATELPAAGFRVLNNVVYNQVLVKAASDEQTDAVIAAVQRSGECWVGGSSWFGERVMRISVCNWRTTPHDVTRSVAAMSKALDAVSSTAS
ncbi:MAG: aminotransferase class V-fold PLP-dependent enzyme [Pseudomonadota bacterium]